jgi:hypothetical protein
MAFANYQEAAKSFRDFIKDHKQLNMLDREIENTDDDLIEYIKDALNDINLGYDPRTNWALKDIIVEPGVDDGQIPWSLVKLGALLQVLTSNGIISARNAVTYSDQGGVTVSDMDKWGRYINYFNVLTAKYERQVMQIKIRRNIQDAFGGASSEFGWSWWYS